MAKGRPLEASLVCARQQGMLAEPHRTHPPHLAANRRQVATPAPNTPARSVRALFAPSPNWLSRHSCRHHYPSRESGFFQKNENSRILYQVEIRDVICAHCNLWDGPATREAPTSRAGCPCTHPPHGQAAAATTPPPQELLQPRGPVGWRPCRPQRAFRLLICSSVVFLQILAQLRVLGRIVRFKAGKARAQFLV